MNPDRNPNDSFTRFPVLGSLRIAADDLEELARQGFVSAERRGDRTYHKLRFRSGGKQTVRYIGNAQRTAAVREELAVLQQTSKTAKELKRRTCRANRAIAEAKRLLEPLLNAQGFAFHGRAIRRPRGWTLNPKTVHDFSKPVCAFEEDSHGKYV